MCNDIKISISDNTIHVKSNNTAVNMLVITIAKKLLNFIKILSKTGNHKKEINTSLDFSSIPSASKSGNIFNIYTNSHLISSYLMNLDIITINLTIVRK